jgi:hypothetical protein
MKIGRFGAAVACIALVAAPGLSSADEMKSRHRHVAPKSVYCPVHRNAEGELVDCQGWRKRANATGWDNSCFNLSYLPSMYACSARGRR